MGIKQKVDRMAGLTWSSARHHYALIPLFACMALGTAFVLGHTLHVAARSPDVILDKRNNPEPWDEYKGGKRYKYFTYFGDQFKPIKKMEGRPDVEGPARS
jgi:NADH dehydrogenase (ubiquinone) 1 alpha subcomplex subunit 4